MPAERRAVRVFARWRDDPLNCPFAFDLLLDGDRIDGQWPIFGATDLDGPDRRPFLLDASGALDFGAPDRNWRTDLRAGVIRVKSLFTIWWTPDDPSTYEIVKIAELGGKTLRPRTPQGSDHS